MVASFGYGSRNSRESKTPSGREPKYLRRGGRDVGMLEPNNPDIDIDELMTRVRSEVLRRQFGGTSNGSTSSAYRGTTPLDTLAIESHLGSAARLAEVRTKWSGQLKVFPFNLLPMQRILLRALAFLFRDQRNVNFEIVHALRENVALNQRMHLRLGELEERLRRFERADANSRNGVAPAD